jgi:collagen type I alpha
VSNYIDLPETGGSGSGVTSLNSLTGTLSLVAGTGIAITPAGSTIEIASTSSGGTVTSVGLVDSTNLFNVTGTPVTAAGNLTLSSFKSQSANTVFAGPNGASGAPTFRSIVPADVPTLNQNTTGTASNITATSNSTLVSLSALTTASSLSTVGTITSGTWDGTTIAIANGGTGQTTAPNAINALLPSQIGNSGKVLGTNGTVSSWISAGGTGSVTSVALVDSTGLFNVTGSPITTSGTFTLASFQSQAQSTFLAAPSNTSGTPSFRLIAVADVPTLNQNTTGTASNITATSNSTLTTLSALSLPGSQVSGNISGNAVNITATSNSTLTTLSALSLPGSQVTGNISGNAANITAASNSTLTTLSALSLPGSQVTGNISGNATNVTASSNSTLTTLSALSLPTTQLSGTVSLTTQVSGTLPIANGGTNATTVSGARTSLGIGSGSSFLTAGTAYTTPSSITTSTQFKFTLIGGGASGASSNTASVHSPGGGSGGGLILYTAGLSPSTGYTIAIGAGGATTASGSAGNIGGNTTLTIGATTYTAGGGNAAGAVTGAGGTGGTSTNGTINIVGGSGGASMAVASSAGLPGGNSPFGFGFGGAGVPASVSANGNPGTGYGGGGGGSASNGGPTGGAGTQGMILVEYWN